MSGHKATPAQAAEIMRLQQLFTAQGKTVCVHWNKCGCCVSVHEDVEYPTEGYIVGRDGGSDRVRT